MTPAVDTSRAGRAPATNGLDGTGESALITALPAVGGNKDLGLVAQLGARLNGIQEVTGSIPVGSTI